MDPSPHSQPAPRSGSTLVAVDSTICVLGGFSPYYISQEQIWLFNASAGAAQWSWVPSPSMRPTAYAAGVAMGRSIMLFGGSYQQLDGAGLYRNSLFVFSPDNMTGYYVNESAWAAAPVPRHLHGLAEYQQRLYAKREVVS